MKVAVGKGRNIKAVLEKVLSDMNFIPGKRVCIKPNWCGRAPVTPGENTSASVLKALIQYLLKRGCEVSLIHGALLGHGNYKIPFEQTLKWAGVYEDRIFRQVKIVNLDELDKQVIVFNGFHFHLPMEYFHNEVETYINLAKIKSHMETGVSFSLKNQMGLASPNDRINMHRTDLEKCIATLGMVIHPDLSILDGYPAMQGNGPHHGRPIPLDMIIAGDNMVELDSLICLLLGYDPANVAHIQYARDAGIGEYFDKNTLNRYDDFSVSGFKKASQMYRFGRRVFAYPTTSCSGCISAVCGAGREFKRHPLRYGKFFWKAFFSRDNIHIVFGKGDHLELDENDNVIFIGRCTKTLAQKYKKGFLDICPPNPDIVADYIFSQLQ